MTTVDTKPRTAPAHVPPPRRPAPPPHRRSPALTAGTGLAVLAAANAALWWAGDHPAVRAASAAALMYVPGRLLLRALGDPMRHPSARAVVSVAASVTVLLLTGLAVNTVAPLSRGPLMIGLDAVLAALVVAAAFRPGQGSWKPPTWRQVGWVAGCLVPPALAVVGAARLNAGGSGAWAVTAGLAAAVALVAGVAMARRVGDAGVAWLLAGVSAALVLSYSTRGAYLFGYDVQQEFGVFARTAAGAAWHPGTTGGPADAYAAMLSITVLPQILTAVCQLAPLDAFRIALPLVLAAFPVAAHVLVRPRLSARAALLVAALPALLPQFMTMMPAVTRQAVALCLFAALVVVLFATGVGHRVRTGLAVLLSTGLVLSHYSTAYIAAMLLAAVWLATTVVRLASRGRWTGKRAVSFVVVAWLVGFSLLWNVGITHSMSNVGAFASSAGSQGVKLLPTDGEPKSLVDRWLRAPVVDAVGGPEHATLAADEYAERYPWMQHYPQSQTAGVRTPSDGPATLRGAFPALRPFLDAGVLLTNQVLNAVLTVGTLLWAWSLRRRRDARLELGLLGLAALAATAVGRVSGAAIASYNPDRVQMQTILILVLGLAFLLRTPPPRPVPHPAPGPRRRALIAAGTVVLGGASAVLFASGTQLSAFAVGGGPAPNFANRGEAAERYLYTDRDVAAARWAGGHVPPGAMIFTDRYGLLPLWSQADRSTGVFPTLAPAAVDVRGYVLLTDVNVDPGRARGLVGRSLSVYRTPVSFYDGAKDLVYSTGGARVYR